LFLLPIKLFFLVFLNLLLLFVLLGGLDAEILKALVLRQLIVMNFHPLGLALVVAVLGLLSGGFLGWIVIGINTQNFLKRGLIHASTNF
jgi:hypothetical protein